MSFRNRPVLDRKHRPRWQDELRTQQLIVAGFALAIAAAIGIFAAAAWNSYYDASLRQVALVDGAPIGQAELTRRTDIIRAELTATAVDVDGQRGGSRDQVLDQQLQAINSALTQVDSVALDALVTGTVFERRAESLGITVVDAELDAEVDQRRTIPERKQLSLILIQAKPAEGAPAGSTPTDADWEAAKATVEAVLAEINAGAEFGAKATERSDDPSKQTAGLLGWIETDDGQYGDYFAAAGDTAAGEVVGPLRNDVGWYLLRVEARKDAGRDELLDRLLAGIGVTDDEYRAYLRSDLLGAAFRDYFATTVLAPYQPQREVAQIFIAPSQGVPVPQQRVRHFLAQPLPGEQDQSTATEDQWAAALARATAFRTEALKPDADWFELAKESDDTGSASQGGDVGWYDEASSSFVPAFKEAIAELQAGEISEPVKTEFGYHVIEVTASRERPAAQAESLVAELRKDPGRFAELAKEQSEDTITANKGGELGWVIPYQFEAPRETAIFDLTEPDQISDPVTTDSGIYIYKLLATSESRFVPESQRTQIGTSGFTHWLDELKDRAGIWLDPELAPATAAG